MFFLLSFGLFAQEKAKQITLFTNVQVFDGRSDNLFKADVLVEGTLIKQISGNNGQVLALSGLKNPYPGAELGVIKEGAFADIIIVNGDPTKDIKLLMDANNIGFIMKDGKIYKNTLK